MKKKIIVISVLVLLAALLVGGCYWIGTDVPEMEYTYEDAVYADWHLDKDGTVTIDGKGLIPWLELEYSYRLYNEEHQGSFYAWIKYKFCDCPIKKVVIGKDVTINTEKTDNPFHYCPHLREIVVNEENQYFSSNDGVLFSKDKTILISYPEGKRDKSYTVPSGVETILAAAFRDNKYLSSVTIQEGVLHIGFNAFQFCSALNSVTLPQGLKSIDDFAFFECKKLKTVSVPASVEEIGEYALGFYINNSWFSETDDEIVKSFKLLFPENANAAMDYAREYQINYQILEQ